MQQVPKNIQRLFPKIGIKWLNSIFYHRKILSNDYNRKDKENIVNTLTFSLIVAMIILFTIKTI
jgi:hypothetical protein